MSYRVYLIVHEQSGRVYFGQTSYDVEHRLSQHFGYNHTRLKTHFANAVRAYGADAFRAYELAAFASKEDADALEVALIHEHDATDRSNGFNITIGGEGHRKARCVHGHDMREPGARTRSGSCAPCDQARLLRLKEQRRKDKQPPRRRRPSRYCGHGHDKWVTGASKRGRCNVCARLYQQARCTGPARQKPPLGWCCHGHEIVVVGRNADGHCRECLRIRGRERYQLQKKAA